MRHQKARNRPAPEQIKRLKRDLGLDRQFLAPVQHFVRMEKTTGSVQTVGGDQEPVISWQQAQRDIGGGADIPNNRFVVPRTGLWYCRVALHTSAVNTDPNSNYRVILHRNGSEMAFHNNHTSTARAITAVLTEDRFFDAEDIILVRMHNYTDSGTPAVDVLEGSHVVFRFIGTVEE